MIGVRTFNIVIAAFKIKNLTIQSCQSNGQIVIDGITGNILSDGVCAGPIYLYAIMGSYTLNVVAVSDAGSSRRNLRVVAGKDRVVTVGKYAT